MPSPNTVRANQNAYPETGCIRKDYIEFGVENKEYGPTETTDFWNGITPPVTGYTIYSYRAVGGPSIVVANDDSELITLATDITGGAGPFATAQIALAYLTGDNSYAVMNITDYPSVVTDGLLTLLDAGSTLSYPKGGDIVWDICYIYGQQQAFLTFVSYSGAAATGGAWYFDGTETYGELPQIISNPDFTIDVWFKAESVVGYSDYALIGKAGPAKNTLSLNTDGSAFKANFAFASPSSEITSTEGVTLGTWNNVVLTRMRFRIGIRETL